jgi:hypothetical protein
MSAPSAPAAGAAVVRVTAVVVVATIVVQAVGVTLYETMRSLARSCVPLSTYRP